MYNDIQAATRVRTVRRGVDSSEIEEGETKYTDHLLLLVHGIGSVCDLKFRTVEEVGKPKIFMNILCISIDLF